MCCPTMIKKPTKTHVDSYEVVIVRIPYKRKLHRVLLYRVEMCIIEDYGLSAVDIWL